MNTHDMFDDDVFNNIESSLFASKVTIAVVKRNGKKSITNVIGMAEDLDLKKILSYLKKTHSCNGSILKHKTHGEIMSFTGDQKENIYNFLVNEEIYSKEDIIIKGV
jgi:translation initiation factor SUI1